MNIDIRKSENINPTYNIAILAIKDSAFDVSFLSDKEYEYAKYRIDKGDTFITINQLNKLVFIIINDPSKDKSNLLEEYRKAGNKVQSVLNDNDLDSISIFHSNNDTEAIIAFTEGIVLSTYRFLKYYTNSEDKKSLIKNIELICSGLSQQSIDELI